MSYTPEELEGIIRSAQRHVSVRKEGKNLRIDVDDQTIRVPYDEELHKRLSAIANEVRALLSGRTRPRAVSTTSDVAHFYTTVRGHRPLVEDLMQRLTWAQRAFLNIGRDTFLAVMMASGEDPKRIPEIVHTFSSEDELHNYVMDKLFNMISASRECAELPSIKEQLWDREVRIAILEDRVDELYDLYMNLYMKVKDDVDTLKRRYEIAQALMTDVQREILSKVLTAVEGHEPESTESGIEEGGQE